MDGCGGWSPGRGTVLSHKMQSLSQRTCARVGRGFLAANSLANPVRPEMKLRTIIVDDERILRQRLRRILSNEAEIEIVEECADGRAALAAVERHKPDLLLLDIGLR